MKRTMKGFLLSECNRLSVAGKFTASLKKLYKAALKPSGARAREYVFLLALELKKLNEYASLSSQLEDLPLETADISPQTLIAKARPFEGDAENFLENYRHSLGKRFDQVLDAFRAPQIKAENDEQAKAIMRNRTLEGLANSGKTAYEMIRDLELNKGNAYAYLRGDTSKVSRATARLMYNYSLASPSS